MERDWLDVFINWFPMLLLIAVWIYFIVAGGSSLKGKTGKTQGQLLEESVDEMKRQNDLLEKIMKDQEVRLQRLEATRPPAALQ